MSLKSIQMLKKIIFALLATLVMAGGILFYLGDKNNSGERNFLPLLRDKLFDEPKEPVNVIFCMTTLQMVIAEKIIEKYPNEKFYAVLISLDKNEKYDYYFQRLKSKAYRAYSFYYDGKDRWRNRNFFPIMLELKLKANLLPKVKSIYLSNMDSESIACFINTHPEAEVNTFDDGTKNLIENTSFTRDDVFYMKNKNQRRFFNIINDGLTITKVREKSQKHNTIFKELHNVMDNGKRKMVYLPLFNASKLKSNIIKKDTIKILLGTTEEKMKAISEKAVKHYGIKYTSRHPRQKYKLDGVETLESKLIIEDYILKEIEKNPNTQYEIYTFFSGAAITMKDFPNLNVYAIKPTSLPKDYFLNPVQKLYQQVGIQILEFKDK